MKLFRDIWFNGFGHQIRPDCSAASTASELTRSLLQRAERWNSAFNGTAVVIPDRGRPAGGDPARRPAAHRADAESGRARPARARVGGRLPPGRDRAWSGGPDARKGCRCATSSSASTRTLLAHGEIHRRPQRRPTGRASPRSPSSTASGSCCSGDATAPEVIAGLRRLGEGPHRLRRGEAVAPRLPAQHQPRAVQDDPLQEVVGEHQRCGLRAPRPRVPGAGRS